MSLDWDSLELTSLRPSQRWDDAGVYQQIPIQSLIASRHLLSLEPVYRQTSLMQTKGNNNTVCSCTASEANSSAIGKWERFWQVLENG